MRSLKRGEIYLYKCDAVGKTRPMLIVSRTEINSGSYVLAVPFYSSLQESRRHKPYCVPFLLGEFGIDRDCVLKADEVSLVRILDFHLSHGPIGVADEEKIKRIDEALAYALHLKLA